MPQNRFSRVPLRAVLPLILLLVPSPWTRGASAVQPERGVPDAISELEAAEDAVDLLESRGREDQAFEASRRWLERALALWKAAGESDQKQRLEARALVALFRMGLLSSACAAPDPAASLLLELKAGLPEGILRSRVEAELRAFARRSHDSPVSPEQMEGLRARAGFVCDWQIIGPFDNERGSGFDRSDPPEAGFDPDGSLAGKLHPVRWRRLPVAAQEVIDLGSVMSPREQCSAYALTAIRVPEARELALRLGSDEGIKVWINDELVHTNDVRREIRLDQDVIGVRLAAGWNKVLVKVTQRQDRWGFVFRLTGPDGGSYTDFEVNADGEHLRTLDYPAGDALRVEVQPGPISWLEERIAVAPDEARSHRHLALMHEVIRPGDEGLLLAHRHALRAWELDPSDVNALYLAALTSVQKASMKPELEENKKRNLLEEVVDRDPRYVPALLQLARYYMASIDAPTAGQSYLRRALAAQVQGADTESPTEVEGGLFDRITSPATAHLQVRWLRARGFEAQADAFVDQLGAAEAKVSEAPEVLMLRADRLSQLGRVSEAIELERRLLDRSLTDSVARRRLLDRLLAAGRAEEAVAVAESAIRMNPFDVPSRLLLADLLEAREDLESAERLVLELVRMQPDSSRLAARYGRLLHRTGRTAKAVVQFERAMTLDPSNTGVRRYLDFLRQKEPDFHEAFPVDAAALAKEAAEILPSTLR